MDSLLQALFIDVTLIAVLPVTGCLMAALVLRLDVH